MVRQSRRIRERSAKRATKSRESAPPVISPDDFFAAGAAPAAPKPVISQDDFFAAPTRRRVAYIARDNDVQPIIGMPDVDFVMLSQGTACESWPEHCRGYRWFIEGGKQQFTDMMLGCLGRASWSMVNKGKDGIFFTNSKSDQTVRLFLSMTDVYHTEEARDAVRSCDGFHFPDKQPNLDKRSVLDGMHRISDAPENTGVFQPADGLDEPVYIGSEWIFVPRGELAPKDLAKIEAAPVRTLVALVAWDCRSVIHRVAHSSLGITSDESGSDAEKDAVVGVLTRRLLHAPRDDAFLGALDALMLATMSECPARITGARWVGDAARVLVAISNRLSRPQLVALKDRLVVDADRTCEYPYEWYCPPVANLLPVLGARHPSLGIDVEQVVTESLEYWIGAEYAVNDLGDVVTSLADLRIHLDQDTCDAVCDTLRRSFSPVDGPREWFWKLVQQTLRALSQPAMRWLRLKFRVRVIGRLSLMRAASAERLYTPGGSGAEEVLCGLRRLAPLVDAQEFAHN